MSGWISVNDQQPPKFTPLVVWNGELSIASLEEDGWYLRDEDGFVYEQVGCGSGCCYTMERKKMWGGPSYWMEVDPPE